MASAATADPSLTASTRGGIIARYEFAKPMKLERSYSCPVRRTIWMSPDKPDLFSNRMVDVDLSCGMSSLALGTPGGGVGAGEGTAFDLKFQFTSRARRKERKRFIAETPTVLHHEQYFADGSVTKEDDAKESSRKKRRVSIDPTEDISDFEAILLRMRDEESKTWEEISSALQNPPLRDILGAVDLDVEVLISRYEAAKRNISHGDS
ncbi:hypothetical protein EX30DRAFT_375651 [Ascodesmis nigricans]|uniref:Uncharacterized protein n=1 Tax=Ascodesmis nigricans TaxID=341454 RepID=A0A4S2MHQ9_9PEZI|nr:hypothetical protein EX30DRAFT_375651 [Ascodesmis nigricans]